MQAGLLDTFTRPARRRGAPAWALSLVLLTFYLLLYLPGSTFFPNFPDWLTPVAHALHLPSKWFLYGGLYSVLMVGGAVTMLRRHGSSRYHRIRTLTLLVVQLSLGFSLPLALKLSGKPELYLSYVWPLSYDKLFPDTLGGLPGAAALWFVFAALVGFPLMAWRYGKRFYCSWICGCGGLAETFGDPWRHLSDKSARAWRFEQVSVHTVLGLVLLMTGLVIADGVSRSGVVSGAASEPKVVAATAFANLSTHIAEGDAELPKAREQVDGLVASLSVPDWLLEKVHAFDTAADSGDKATAAARLSDVAYAMMPASPLGHTASVVKGLYSFFIGAMFSGVLGVGLYPLMGTRVWCRFGCPMAAILGLMQKLGRFRIKVKPDMCISCGNCSTYCEMGIDVRAYAMANLDIRRASCVGCGMCAHVCPRGVLQLTHAPDAGPGASIGEWVLDL